MYRLALIAALVVGALVAFGCSDSGSPSSPVTPGLNAQAGNPEGHVAWGVFDVVIDAESNTAEIVWNRDAEMHLNVTNAIKPPNCYDCIAVVDTSYDAYASTFYLQMAFKNPTAIVGYDVRGVISNPGGQKFLMNPDGVTSVWGAPMQFRAINADPERTFGGFEIHGRMFQFYFPGGENWASLTYILDASWPGYVEEPLIEEGASDPVANNGFSTTYVRARVWDHQGDVNPATVTADLMALGGSPMTPLYDDGQHNDLAPGDGVFGSSLFTTTVAVGMYMVNVYAVDYSGHMGWGQARLSVQQTTGGPNDDPVIDSITTDRTTANGSANEKVKITVNAHDPNGDPLGYDFQATSGTFTGQTGNSAYWKPVASNTGPQTITVNVLDDKGGTDSQTLTLWSTDLSVINGGTQGMLPPGTLQAVKPTATLHMPGDFDGMVVYINFWATWCGYCVAEMPDLTNVYNEYKDNPDYVQIFIDLQEDQTTVMNFINSNNFNCSYWALDPNGSYFGACNDFNGNSNGIPQHVVFDRDGRCRWANLGMLSSTAPLTNAIDQLL